MESNVWKNQSTLSRDGHTNGYLGLGSIIESRIFIIVELVLELLFSWYLHYRQNSHINSIDEVPSIIRRYDDGLYLPSDLDFCKKYSLEKVTEEAVLKLYTVWLWLTAISLGLISFCWDSTNEFLDWWPNFFDPIISRNVMFAMVCYAAKELVMLPVHCSKVLRRVRHNKVGKGVREFFWKYSLNLVANVTYAALIAGAVTWAVMTLDSYPEYTQYIVIGIIVSHFVLLYPSLEMWYIIHDREVSLMRQRTLRIPGSRSEEALETRLQLLCDRIGFPRNNLILSHSGTRQTSAYYFGFLWYRRIIIFQAIKDQSENDEGEEEEEEEAMAESLSLTVRETEAVVAHELGHWQFSHSDQSLLIFHIWHVTTALAVYWLRSNPLLHQVFYLSAEGNDHVNQGAAILPGALVAYYLILRLYNALFEVLSHIHSAFTESQADLFASVDLGYHREFAKSLIKIIVAQQTTFPSSDPIFQAVYHNHPSLVARLENIHEKSRSRR